jgi:hypothetical protein
MPSSDIGVAVAKAELNISVYNQPNFVFNWVVAIYFALKINDIPSSDIVVAVAKAELNSSVYDQPNFVLS